MYKKELVVQVEVYFIKGKVMDTFAAKENKTIYIMC